MWNRWPFSTARRRRAGGAAARLLKGRIAALCLAALLQACAPPPSDAIRMALASPPVTLDPRFALDATSTRLCRLLYQTPIDFDARFQVQPLLAEVQELAPDRYRLRLRGDPVFADGSPLTAGDVAATYGAVLDPRLGSPHRGSLAHIAAIESIDARTVDFVLARPDPLFPGRLTVGVLPAAIARAPAAEFRPLGSGPFELAAMPGETRIELRRRRDGQAVVFETVRDPNVRALKLARGEVDLLQGDLSPELYDWLARRGDLQLLEARGSTYSYLGLNLREPALADPAVRRALAMAIDRQALVQHVFRGRARPGETVLPADHWAAARDLVPYPYDPAAARALLQARGYTPAAPLRLSYRTSTDPLRQRLAAILQQQLAQVGIALSLSSHDFGTLYGDIRAGRFQLYALSWVGLKLTDHFHYAFHGSSVPPSGANRGYYRNPEVDALIEAAERAARPAARIALLHEIQHRLHRDLPFIPLWYEDTVAVVRRDLQGYAASGDGNFDALAQVGRRAP